MFFIRFFLIILFLISHQAFAQVILIDPGHGGEEVGAIGRYFEKNKFEKKIETKNILEKELTLIYSNLLQEKLSRKFTVLLTRSYDRFVGLEERAEMASKINADLYLSIHFNSSVEPLHQGFEIFYLDNHQDKAVKKLEDYENLVTDKKIDKEISSILIDLVISKTVVASKSLASTLHNEIKQKSLKKFKIKDRGVKPGLFHVLALAQRPGVLIEMGFLSNKNELQIIMDQKFQNEMTDNIANGIINYFKKSKK